MVYIYQVATDSYSASALGLRPTAPVALVQATGDSINVFRVVGLDRDGAPYVLTGKGLDRPHGWDDPNHGGWILEPEWPGIQFGCHWRGDIDAFCIPFGVVLRARDAAGIAAPTWPVSAWQGDPQVKVVGDGARPAWEVRG